MSETTGKLIVLEGVDGAGKSTQAYLLSKYLGAQRKRVLPVREPGGTAIGEKIREILLDHSSAAITSQCELLLYMASRAQLVGEVIKPTLALGHIIISERFLLSSLAYQGYAGGMSLEAVEAAGALAVLGVEPDLTIILDIDPEIAMSRDKGASIVSEEQYDRIEKKGVEFQKKVRAGFLELAKTRGDRVKVIDAARPPKVVHEDIKKLVAGVIG